MYDTKPPLTERERDTVEGGPLDFSTFMQEFAQEVKDYVRAERRYLSMHLADKTSTLLGKAVESVVVLATVAMVLLFLSIALSLYLGELLSSFPLGFAIVAGIYALSLGIFSLWWSMGGRDRFILDRINDFNDNDD